MGRVEVHPERDADPRQRADEADGQHVVSRERAQHLRQPEDHAVGTREQAEPQQARQRNERVAQHAPVVAHLARRVARRVATQPVALFGRQPSRLVRRVREIRRRDDAGDERRQSLRDEHEAPRRQSERRLLRHEPARQRRADHHGHRDCDHGQGERGGAFAIGRELAEVDHDARREAPFGHADQHAQGIELRVRFDERHRTGRQAPQDRARGEPRAHAHPLQQQHAGVLAGEKTREQDAGAETVLSGGEAQLGVHRRRREADVRAIQRAHQQENGAGPRQACLDLARDRIAAHCLAPFRKRLQTIAASR